MKQNNKSNNPELHKLNRTILWDKKEKIYVDKEGSFPCPDDTHPLFTINVTKKRLGVCYYCSKVFLYKENLDE